MSTETVWVARVDTRYEVVAVARTEREAIEQACHRALKYLRDGHATVEGETDTVERIEEYFGVWAQEIPLGGAALWGL